LRRLRRRNQNQQNELKQLLQNEERVSMIQI